MYFLEKINCFYFRFKYKQICIKNLKKLRSIILYFNKHLVVFCLDFINIYVEIIENIKIFGKFLKFKFFCYGIILNIMDVFSSWNIICIFCKITKKLILIIRCVCQILKKIILYRILFHDSFENQMIGIQCLHFTKHICRCRLFGFHLKFSVNFSTLF